MKTIIYNIIGGLLGLGITLLFLGIFWLIYEIIG